MRVSQGLFVTWREAPSDAETLGTTMLSRAGFVRKLGSGLYASLPLMQRVLLKLESLIREELSGVAQEVSFPMLQPEGLWRESGRWEVYTRAEGLMFTVEDRAGRRLALGPTHEEVSVAVVRELARSYRDLPVSVYQIARKFRDELRPRFGAAAPLPLDYMAPDLPDSVIAVREGLHPAFLRLCDEAAAGARNFTTGANEPDMHVTGANWEEDFALPEVVDLRQARAGDACLHDDAQVLHSARGIEVGHVFGLGTRYAEAMNARFTAPDGTAQPFQMGCYGIGVTRLAQAVAEGLADERGLVWPAAIAPYEVMLTVVDMNDAAQVQAAEALYAELRAAGVDVLLDDRAERPGVKFADADLTGIPYRVTLGRALAQGEVEVRERRNGEVRRVPVGEVTAFLRERLAGERRG